MIRIFMTEFIFPLIIGILGVCAIIIAILIIYFFIEERFGGKK